MHKQSALLVAACLLLAQAPVSDAGLGATVFTVDTTDDTLPEKPVADAKDKNGHTSLRAAIMAANQTAGVSKIEFNIPNGDTIVPLIVLGSLLPETSHPIVIDGATEPGLAAGARIRLAPASGSLAYGLFLVAGRSAVSALQFEGFSNGIILEAGGSNAIKGNRFVTARSPWASPGTRWSEPIPTHRASLERVINFP